jgi:hypothetical protein
MPYVVCLVSSGNMIRDMHPNKYFAPWSELFIACSVGELLFELILI